MRFVLLSLTLVTLMLACTAMTLGQTPQDDTPTPINYVGWYIYEGKHSFIKDKPWGLFFAVELQRDDIVRHNLDIETRVALVYNLLSRYEIMGGYVFKYNYPYDQASQPYNWADHRVWEQVQWNYHLGETKRYTLTPRIRVEQRWLERKSGANLDQISWEFENTFRGQLRFDTRLNDTVTLRFFDEAYLRAPPPELGRLLDANVFFAGFLFNLDSDKRWRLEAGYVNRSFWHSAETQTARKRINHTIRIAVFFDAPFRSR
jgi:Protein of unknown function (DUF2490)